MSKICFPRVKTELKSSDLRFKWDDLVPIFRGESGKVTSSVQPSMLRGKLCFRFSAISINPSHSEKFGGEVNSPYEGKSVQWDQAC